MKRSRLAAASIVVVTVALVGACRHEDGRSAGVTTTTSGKPEGVRVTNVPPPSEETSRKLEAARIATSLCGRERRCTVPASEEGTAAGLHDGAKCVAKVEPEARRSIESWSCSPAVVRAGMKDCVAAVTSAVRCRDVLLLGESAPVAECRPSNICKGQGSTQ
jgi:hypothetical protein